MSLSDTNPIRQVMVVEDDANDFKLIQHALQAGGTSVSVRCIDTVDELEEELLRLVPDVVLCDHASAKWNSLAILDQVRAFESSIPFVVVSGSLDEPMQAYLLAHGADGCVDKNHLSDLNSILHQALRQRAEEQRRQVEELRRQIIPLRKVSHASVSSALEACVG